MSVLRIPAVSGSNMLVTADAFAAVGGFDTELTCNEDSELGWRIARAGFDWRFDLHLIALATDHRRLRRGVFRKTLHTVLRCSALYLDLLPRRWRSHDWGYWRDPRQVPE
jgi:GT2 family glycosyltransferase